MLVWKVSGAFVCMFGVRNHGGTHKTITHSDAEMLDSLHGEHLQDFRMCVKVTAALRLGG